MVFENYYWYFESALPHKFCDEVIKHGLNNKSRKGLIGGVDKNLEKEKLTYKDKKILKQVRDSDVVFLDDLWIHKEIQPFIKEANKNAGWNFDWDSSEKCQFTKYKLNQFYDWHCDSLEKPYKNNGKIRKLSVTCQLTDGSKYEGGELEFDFRNQKEKHFSQAKEIFSKGSIIVFPSHVWHRVKPVTKGVRYSLVIWNLGYPFK